MTNINDELYIEIRKDWVSSGSGKKYFVPAGSNVAYAELSDNKGKRRGWVTGYQYPDHQIFHESDLVFEKGEFCVFMLSCDGETASVYAVNVHDMEEISENIH